MKDDNHYKRTMLNYLNTKREKLIETMINFHIHHVDTIVRVYSQDKNSIKLEDEFQKEREITNGIKQVCTV